MELDCIDIAVDRLITASLHAMLSFDAKAPFAVFSVGYCRLRLLSWSIRRFQGLFSSWCIDDWSVDTICAFSDAGIVSWKSLVGTLRRDHACRDLGAPRKTGSESVANRRDMWTARRHITRTLGMGQATHQRIAILFILRVQSLDGFDKYRACSAGQHYRGSQQTIVC
jgi:hypothetical protein